MPDSPASPGRMIIMKKTLCLTVPVLLLILASAAADPLWDRAVQLYTRGQELYAGNVIVQSSELDSRGRIKEFWEMEYEVLHDETGQTRQNLLWVRRDGEPATAEELEERENRRENDSADTGYFAGVDVLPLDMSARDEVKAENTGTREWVDGQDCFVFSFSQIYSGGAETSGRAWITEDGFPVRMEMEFINLPFYIREMRNTVTFTSHEETAVPKEVKMEGFISFVVYKFRFISNIFFRNYQHP